VFLQANSKARCQVEKIIKVRKQQECSNCSAVIAIGERCEKQTYPMVRGGSPEYQAPDYTCQACLALQAEIRVRRSELQREMDRLNSYL
jgi:hypothetical protein